MEIVAKEVYLNRDYDSLYAFLKYCQARAKEKEQVQVACICLETRYLDPLAVLQSIYEAESLSFYFEHPVSDFAIAGAEAVVEASFEGPERFEKVRDFSRQVLENTIVIGDLDVPFSGPHFFTSFTFYDEVLPRSAFPPARVFLPRWQVGRNGSSCIALANIPVAPEGDLEFLAQKVWAAHKKFNSFDYQEVALTGDNENARFVEVGGLGWYEKAVKTATSCIEKGEFDKIVIARELDIEGDKAFDSLTSLNRLREAFPLCFSCFVANGKGQSFSSATPERLLKVVDGRVKTEAVAGSTSRGSSAADDAYLGKMLLESDKDLREHRFVVDSIVERLQSLGIASKLENKPRLKKLANIQHLCTPIEADMPRHLHFLDIAAVLHPTPAVCGTPLEASRQRIAKIENFDRGLYAGAIGWFNYHGDGELVVGIRSALIDGRKARLYSGGGIVEGSDPESERRETDIKLQAMLANLR